MVTPAHPARSETHKAGHGCFIVQRILSGFLRSFPPQLSGHVISSIILHVVRTRRSTVQSAQVYCCDVCLQVWSLAILVSTHLAGVRGIHILEAGTHRQDFQFGHSDKIMEELKRRQRGSRVYGSISIMRPLFLRKYVFLLLSRVIWKACVETLHKN